MTFLIIGLMIGICLIFSIDSAHRSPVYEREQTLWMCLIGFVVISALTLFGFIKLVSTII